MDLHAFHLALAHSRKGAIVWSERADRLAWLHVHNEALRRLGELSGEPLDDAASFGCGPRRRVAMIRP